MKSLPNRMKNPLKFRSLLIIMKLTLAFSILFTLNLSANGFSQDRVTLNAKKVEIVKVLVSIEQQTYYRFLYNDDLQSIKNKVNIKAINATVDDVLKELLFNTPLTFKKLPNSLIVINEEAKEKRDEVVNGTVLDVSGKPLMGISVQVKGTAVGTITDSSGNFTIRVPNTSVTLVFTSIGYITKEEPLSGRSNLTVVLAASAQNLEQVIVVGYGSQRKIDVTGSVASINGNEIAKQPSANPLSGLQGKVAGVQITNSGAPGSSPDILIRGLGTFNAKTSPLYVVDGVWVDNIQFLNSADIENISVLKDASSQAIFGVKGANGVVLITTKKGAKSKVSINYNGFAGWQVANNIPKMANAHEYAIMFNELGRANKATSFLDSSQFSEGTNWFNQALRNGVVNNQQISVNGGSEKSTYNLSIGYLNQQGILKTNDYKRYTASFKNDVKVTKNITVGYTVIGQHSKTNNPPGGIWRQLYTTPSVLPVRFADDTYGDPGYYGLGAAIANPQTTLDYSNSVSQGYHLNGSAYTDIKILKHFTWHTDFGGLYENGESKNFTPIYKANSNQQSTHNTLSMGTSSQKNWIVNNTLTYYNNFGEHRITVLVGQSAQRIFGYSTTGTAQDGSLSSNPQTWYLSLGNGGGIINDNPSLEKVSSYFGRATYSFMDRYTLTGTLRSDASSLFTANSGRATLPSIGAAWIVSNESFMQNQKGIDVLKLKASWGIIGNSGVPLQASVAQTDNNNIIFGNNGTLLAGQSISKPIPPPLNWEKSQGYDVGIEAAFLGNRLSVDADYYNKETRNFIFALFLPGSSGYSTSYLLQNIGGVRNKGFELSINWQDNISKDFSYSIGGNISKNDNEFYQNNFGGNQKFYSGGAASTGGQLGTVTTLGMPVGVFYGYKVVGIFQSTADVSNYKDANGTLYQPNAKPGDFKYAKLSNDGTGAINAKDRTILGNPNPKWMYGINTNFSYKRFDLSLDFNGVGRVDIYNANKGLRFGNENFTKEFFDNRWHGEGTSNSNPSVSLGGGQNYYINSWYVENGSYFRIRNVQFGYDVPLGSGQRLGISKLRLFANAQNPIIFTKYTGFSPEIVGGAPGNRGIDNNVYPIYATYNFGVNLTF